MAGMNLWVGWSIEQLMVLKTLKSALPEKMSGLQESCQKLKTFKKVTENLHKSCWKLKNVIRLACKKVAENSPTMHFLVSTLHPATLQHCNTAILRIILKMLQCYTEDGDAKHTKNSKLWSNQLLRACATVLAVLHWIYIFVFVFTTACIIFSFLLLVQLVVKLSSHES